MKKKVILALILVVIFIFVNNKEKELNVLETKELNNNTLSMMLETSAGTGEYQEVTASSWPTEGYVFNENLSICENGSNLSWDNINKKVIMEGNSADKCYVYFDVKPPETLANHIKSLYTTQGANNLYLHDSTLENGAGDNSYRFAGPSETTNNFVCFGYDSQDGTCPTDNLYRIIGVFGDNVKLIKYDYAKASLLGTDGDYVRTYEADSSSYKGNNTISDIGVYTWSSELWKEANINTVNLNMNFLNNIGNKWSNKITINSWKLGNASPVSYHYNSNEIYKNEIGSSRGEIKTKISLMYMSDYGYAAAPSAWNTILDEYSILSVKSVNWMYMGLSESTSSYTALEKITRAIEPNSVLYIESSGGLGAILYYNSFSMRPAFYLNSNVSYISGSGTISSPYILE